MSKAVCLVDGAAVVMSVNWTTPMWEGEWVQPGWQNHSRAAVCRSVAQMLRVWRIFYADSIFCIEFLRQFWMRQEEQTFIYLWKRRHYIGTIPFLHLTPCHSCFTPIFYPLFLSPPSSTQLVSFPPCSTDPLLKLISVLFPFPSLLPSPVPCLMTHRGYFSVSQSVGKPG